MTDSQNPQPDERFRAQCDEAERTFANEFRDWLQDVPAPPAPVFDESSYDEPIGQTEGLSLDGDTLDARTRGLGSCVRHSLWKLAVGVLEAQCELIGRASGGLSIAERRRLLRDRTREHLSDIRHGQWARMVDTLVEAHYEWDQEQADIPRLFDEYWTEFEAKVAALVRQELEPTLVRAQKGADKDAELSMGDNKREPPTDGMATSGPSEQQRGRKRGPRPDRESAARVAEIVTRLAPDGYWRPKLDDICEALDEAQIPCPKRWRRQRRPCGQWAGYDEPAKAVKAIDYRLKQAREQTLPSETLA